MTVTLDARVAREKETYEQGLKRKLYDKILRHAVHLYRDHRTALAAEAIRAAEGRRALELGSQAWVRFVDQADITPSELICINVSERELEKGRQQALTSRVKPTFALMDAHQLEFPDESFDVVFGTAIIHHLQIEAALVEIARVLRPGGVFVFAEPMDNNPVGRIVRSLTPAARTADERPFRHAELDLMRRHFQCRFHYEQFLSVPAGVLSGLVLKNPDNPLMRLAFAVDELLLRAWPSLGPYFRYVLMIGSKPRAVAA